MIAFIASKLGVGRLLGGVIAWTLGAAIIGGAAWGVYAYVKSIGADEVRRETQEQNNEAGIAGGEARMSRADCHDRGGVYDFRTGRCRGLEAGDRE